jgi:glutamate-1-semialdehyde 2,1-aminomutase
VNGTDKEKENEFYFSMIANDGIFFLPGHIGAISTAHTKADIENFIDAADAFARSQREP